MKKFTYQVIITVAVLIAGFFAVRAVISRSIKPDLARCGNTAKDFLLGMKGTTVYNLRDFMGRYTIILSFSDTSEQSKKFAAELPAQLNSFLGKKDLVWFNVRKEDDHAVIEDFTGNTGFQYRTLYSDIPKFYTFPAMPSVIIIDKGGVIQFVYIGYSPTLYRDVRGWLGKPAR